MHTWDIGRLIGKKWVRGPWICDKENWGEYPGLGHKLSMVGIVLRKVNEYHGLKYEGSMTGVSLLDVKALGIDGRELTCQYWIRGVSKPWAWV